MYSPHVSHSYKGKGDIILVIMHTCIMSTDVDMYCFESYFGWRYVIGSEHFSTDNIANRISRLVVVPVTHITCSRIVTHQQMFPELSNPAFRSSYRPGHDSKRSAIMKLLVTQPSKYPSFLFQATPQRNGSDRYRSRYPGMLCIQLRGSINTWIVLLLRRISEPKF
jgi:hypothetical protein